MHGVLTCGCLLNGSVHPLVMKSDAACLVGSGLFDISFLSDLLYWYNFKPWTKEIMMDKMTKGENVMVMPGGFEEASIYKRGAHQTYLKCAPFRSVFYGNCCVSQHLLDGFTIIGSIIISMHT
eukprot:scaffold65954_cov47-Prasinocladus_malaysianus.AAC.1